VTDAIVRPVRDDEAAALLAIVNAAALAYRGKIPADCWHEPYFSAADLRQALDLGIAFWGLETQGVLAGVIGVQRARNADLIRHAYVAPAFQGRGAGSRLIAHACRDRPMLVGTWRAATWAIRFYERHGFERVPEAATARLLKAYWEVSERQAAVSVVLARPALDEAAADALVAGAAP
jgi:GNAT superfamily N-acetyltransferase